MFRRRRIGFWFNGSHSQDTTIPTVKLQSTFSIWTRRKTSSDHMMDIFMFIVPNLFHANRRTEQGIDFLTNLNYWLISQYNRFLEGMLWSHTETLPASTSPLNVRIIENKLWRQLVRCVVHLCSDQRHQGFGINEYLHSWDKFYIIQWCVLVYSYIINHK